MAEGLTLDSGALIAAENGEAPTSPGARISSGTCSTPPLVPYRLLAFLIQQPSDGRRSAAH